MNRRGTLRSAEEAALERHIRERTPARLLVGRSGAAYRTSTQLQLRADHAAARDAVACELDLVRDLGADFVERWKLFVVSTRAGSKADYLLRPDLGRELDDSARNQIVQRCPAGADLQIAIGDGLSASDVAAQIPALLPLLADEAVGRGWTLGRPFAIRHCRVGVMNAIGEVLRPRVVVLLIGERPGMSAVESLSAYMAYRPRSGHTDADRNLVSNIHGAGVSAHQATLRIANLAAAFLQLERSGATIKEP